MAYVYNYVYSCLLFVLVKDVPLLVEVCVGIIEDRGVDSQGIYRVPGQAGIVQELQEQLDRVSIYVTLYCVKNNNHNALCICLLL